MPKLTKDDQVEIKADLDHMADWYGLHWIVSICMECGEYTGIKDGEGNHGVSHELCKGCLEKHMEELRK